jgi:hypothetical protein
VKEPPTKPQIDKFKETAREIEADDNEKRFDERLKRVAKTSLNAKRSSKRS